MPKKKKAQKKPASFDASSDKDDRPASSGDDNDRPRSGDDNDRAGSDDDDGDDRAHS